MGESNAGVIVLSVLLVLALVGAGYLLYENQKMKRGIEEFEPVLSDLVIAHARFNKVLISPEGDISYPKARTLKIPGSAGYAYELEEEADARLGTPRPLDEQSAFDLCYRLTQTEQEDGKENHFTIELKDVYSEDFYQHCEGDYEFPIIIDEEEFSTFTLLLIPGPER